jgi:uroporphyrinogen-III synthase
MALAADLRARGFRVIRHVVYAATPAAKLPSAAQTALAAGSLSAALFFSAETARHCVKLLLRARLHEAVLTMDAVAIGKPAAVALQALPWRRIRVAAQPNQDAMLALLR